MPQRTKRRLAGSRYGAPPTAGSNPLLAAAGHAAMPADMSTATDTFDQLTGLLSRGAFLQMLVQALNRNPSRRGAVAVLLIDLDRFKAINDARGRQCGDDLLCAVARRIAACLGPPGSLTAAARLGGDEFAVLIGDVARGNAAYVLARQVLESLRRPFTVGGQRVSITAAGGLATSGLEAAWPSTLLRDADLALFEAKAAGGDCVFVFPRGRRARPGTGLERELYAAVKRRELRLVYQPEVALETGAIVGFEALVRWQHPRLGLVMPAEFIPLAERGELMPLIGGWVLEEACRQTAAWRAARPKEPPYLTSVNLSVRQLQQPDFVQQVERVLHTTGLAPCSLRLEVTESALLVDVDRAAECIRGLRALGTAIAIDDFGTGYASLSYLQHFEADTLKIDRSFVSKLDTDPRSAAIVENVVALGRSLAMDVTAEGIETDSQLQQLRALHCARGQGWLFSKPLPAEAVPAALAGNG